MLFTVTTARRETGLRTALARSLVRLGDAVTVATTARDYGHPDGPAGPVWAPVTHDADAVRRVRLPDLPQAGDTDAAEPATTGATDVHHDRLVAAVRLPAAWLDYESWPASCSSVAALSLVVALLSPA